MTPHFKLDTTRFDAAIQAYIPTTRKTLVQIVNQRAINVVERAFDSLPPANPDTQRGKVRSYLRQPLSTNVKLAKSGKRKGQFIKRGARNNQLQRVHLIVQAKRAKAGLPGLYGKKMLHASGKFVSFATKGVGFVKSLFLPAIIGLNPFAQKKVPHSKTHKIARWPGGAGYGRAAAAREGDKPTVTFVIGAALRKVGHQEGKVKAIVERALQFGLNAEAAEIRRHVEDKMRQITAPFNAKKR